MAQPFFSKINQDSKLCDFAGTLSLLGPLGSGIVDAHSHDMDLRIR